MHEAYLFRGQQKRKPQISDFQMVATKWYWMSIPTDNQTPSIKLCGFYGPAQTVLYYQQHAWDFDWSKTRTDLSLSEDRWSIQSHIVLLKERTMQHLLISRIVLTIATSLLLWVYEVYKYLLTQTDCNKIEKPFSKTR